MTNETLHETEDGVVLQDPKPVLNAPPKVLKRLERIIDLYLDIQADWAKRFSWLEGMTNIVKMWLQRDDLPENARASGANVSNDFDQRPML